MKIIERRYITPDDLRRICIEENWYTLGDNSEYSHMLGMCRKGWDYANLTTARVEKIAADIQAHSDVKQDTDTLLNIMCIIVNAASTYFEMV